MPAKGVINNPKGRPRGKPNKITSELRQKLKNVIEAEFEKLPELLKELPPEERIPLLIKLLPFCLPKVESVYPEWGEPNPLKPVANTKGK